VPDQSRPNRVPWPGVALLLLSSVPSLLGGRRRRRPRVQGRELNAYRRNLTELTSMIDLELVSLADLVDALRSFDPAAASFGLLNFLFKDFRQVELRAYFLNKRFIPVLGNLLPRSIESALASRWGWHLWIYATK